MNVDTILGDRNTRYFGVGYKNWSPVNKIDNLNRDFLPMLRLSFELEFGTHLQTALVI